MEHRGPSRTALRAAWHRAAHQIWENGRIFSDPLAVQLLGREGEALLADHAREAPDRAMRFFVVARAALAEAALTARIARGEVSQLVVLGAGLDTFAYRQGAHGGLRVFEVDHPATQVWKRAQLRKSGIAVPDTVSFVPVDFERAHVPAALREKGFEPDAPSFFTWLGVVPYLAKVTVLRSLRDIAAASRTVELVFDYADPPETLPPEMQAMHAERAQRVAALGEPWRTFFERAEMADSLRGAGFRDAEDFGPAALIDRFAPGMAMSGRRERGGHVVRAWTG